LKLIGLSLYIRWVQLFDASNIN